MRLITTGVYGALGQPAPTPGLLGLLTVLVDAHAPVAVLLGSAGDASVERSATGSANGTVVIVGEPVVTLADAPTPPSAPTEIAAAMPSAASAPALRPTPRWVRMDLIM